MSIKEQEKKLNTILRRKEVSKKLRNEDDQDNQEIHYNLKSYYIY